MESLFCPSCEREVPIELVKQPNYTLHVCSFCGMGLKVSPVPQTAYFSQGRGITANLAGTSGENPNNSQDAFAYDPNQSLGDALGQLRLVKRPTTLQPIVERPTSRLDPRSIDDEPALSSNDHRHMPQSVDSAPSANGALPSASAPEVEQRRSLARALLVDRDDVLRSICKVLLVERHCAQHVDDAPTAAEALETYMRACLADERPELAILEMAHPDMTGIELAYALRAIEKGLALSPTPILFFAAEPLSDANREILKEIRRVRFVQKPQAAPEQQSAKLLAVMDKLLTAAPHT